MLSFNVTKDSLVLLATDGLWDVMSNEEAAELARRNLERMQNNNLKKKDLKDKMSSGEMLALVCRALAEAAYDRGSTDNVTIVAVKMP